MGLLGLLIVILVIAAIFGHVAIGPLGLILLLALLVFAFSGGYARRGWY